MLTICQLSQGSRHWEWERGKAGNQGECITHTHTYSVLSFGLCHQLHIELTNEWAYAFAVRTYFIWMSNASVWTNQFYSYNAIKMTLFWSNFFSLPMGKNPYQRIVIVLCPPKRLCSCFNRYKYIGWWNHSKFDIIYCHIDMVFIHSLALSIQLYYHRWFDGINEKKRLSTIFFIHLPTLVKYRIFHP